MTYDERSERAEEHARAALSQMARQRIAATPANFELWYAYHARSRPELVTAVDAALKRGRVSEATCRALYERFLAHGDRQERSALAETSDAIRRVVGGALTQMGEAGRNAADYGDSLRNASGALEGAADAAKLNDIVQRLLGDTRRMEERNRELEAQLRSSSSEILELRQSLDAVRQEASTDALTGIGNRKAFDHALAASIDAGVTLCVMLLDIDFFKKFNDTYGHATGDIVLRLVGDVIRKSVREADVAARYGGEEFAVLMPETALLPAHRLAERVRQSVAERKLVQRNTGARLGSVTLSIGVASLRADDTAGTVLDRADRALYKAKRDGRNRVALETELDLPMSEPD